MKTTLVILAIIAIGALAFAAPWSLDFFKQKTDGIDKAFKNQTSDEYVINARRTELNKDLENVQEKAYRVEQNRNELLEKEAELAKKRTELAKAVNYLQLSNSWLKSHNPADTLSVNGKTYGYATVSKDVQTRTKECVDLEMITDTMQESVNVLSRAIEEANDAIQKRFDEIRYELSTLAATETKLLTLRELEKAQKMINNMGLDQLKGSDRYETEIKERIGRIEAKIKYSINTDKSAGIVDYASEQTATTVLEAAQKYIDAYMSKSAIPASATATQ